MTWGKHVNRDVSWADSEWGIEICRHLRWLPQSHVGNEGLCLYKAMSLYLSYKSQSQLLKEQWEIGSTFDRLINACSKTENKWG